MNKIKVIIDRIRQFLRESKVELKKVTWPTPKEALASTSVVLAVVIIVSIFLGMVDFGLTKIIRVFLG
ncbi:MAG: preprotein translocase subunit SecE [Deltaproteobacteria bacterium]|jgi:preprotein translocase subunit SecE|nr:preprotein translocase subunit SecE [Deltaproteobacteria bacterium]